MRRILMASLLALPLCVSAEMVDIKWTNDVFAHKTSIAPKKFLEVCGKLKMGDGVTWQFTGSAPTDFNIHYHVGNDVSYPENRKDVASASGTLSVSLDQDYCWMWSNKSAQPAEVDVQLRQTGRKEK